MARQDKLIINHFIANNLTTRWSCDWLTLNSVKQAIATHNDKVDAYNNNEIAEFEVVQSAVTISTTLDSLGDAECHNPLLESPLFVGPHQGGTLVNIHYEPRRKDEITEWLEASGGLNCVLANSAVDAAIIDDHPPIKSADIAVTDNKFEYLGSAPWQGNPVMSVKFDSNDDAERFKDLWHMK